MWVYVIGAYLLGGVATVSFPRGRRLVWDAGQDLRPSSNPFSEQRQYPIWKVATFYLFVCATLILLWPLAVAGIMREARRNTPERIREFGRRSRAEEVGKGWLRNRITIEEAEAKHMVDLDLGQGTSNGLKRARLEFARSRSVSLTGKPIPFGFLNYQWREMMAYMQDGDELWEYRSFDHSWEHLAGRAGIALVRKGEIVDAITTTMS